MAASVLIHTPRFERRRKKARLAQNQELMHIRDLVRLRRILARYGASADELRSYDAEIDRQRVALTAPHTAAA
jgi:hypothetical protein